MGQAGASFCVQMHCSTKAANSRRLSPLVLRVPLHPPDEPFVRHPNRLDQAVGGAGHRLQPGRQGLDGLMVPAGDIGLGPAQQGGKGGARQDGHLVGRLVVGRLLLMLDGRGRLAGQILPERAAQSHIEQLDAPADAQNGLVRRKGHPEQPQLHLVPPRHHQTAGGQLFLAVEGGVRVRPAGKQQPAAHFQNLRKGALVGGQRQHDRQRAGPFQRLKIGRHHPITVPLDIHQRDQTDQRFFHPDLPSPV